MKTSCVDFAKHTLRIAVLIAQIIAATAWNLAAQEPIRFADSTASSKLDFVHEDGADNEGFLVSLMGSGLATFDYDNDGLIDVYFLTGVPLPKQAVSAKGLGSNQPTHALYRNLGSNSFAKVGQQSHCDLSAFGLGIAIADYDNDGFQDAAISNFGSMQLLHNNGDGTFSEITKTAGLAESGIAFGAGVAFLDVENDGDLDLYVADYVGFTFERFKEMQPSSFPYPPGPEQFEHRSDHLFINGGDGTFVDGSQAAGIADYRSPSMGIVCGDFDNDKDTDIFVCSDARPNLYFVNDGKGVFKQEAQLQAVAFNAEGVAVGSMGAEAADLDNDADEDIFVTTYSAQMPLVYKNLVDLGFEDVAVASRAGLPILAHVKWGAGLVDFDNDGDRDLMIGNGHLFKWANTVEQLTAFKMRNCLLANNGKGSFKNITADAGAGMQIVESSRGLCFDDLDNDGDVDCVVLNSDAPASFLENRTSSDHNWIDIELRGTRFNRDGVGAKVTVQTGKLTQVSEVHSGRAYQSHYGSRLHFGIGKSTHIDRVTVDWLGEVTEHQGLTINQVHLIKQPEK